MPPAPTTEAAMYWTEWRDYGPWEWFIVAFGIANVAWALFVLWLVLQACWQVVIGLIDGG
jgi:hypothetical protein